MTSQSDLFGPQLSREQRHAKWLNELRTLVLAEHAGEDLTTDQVWAVMAKHGITIPRDASPNILGQFFAAWDEARPVMLTPDQQRTQRSERPEARGNRLSVWRIAGRMAA